MLIIITIVIVGRPPPLRYALQVSAADSSWAECRRPRRLRHLLPRIPTQQRTHVEAEEGEEGAWEEALLQQGRGADRAARHRTGKGAGQRHSHHTPHLLPLRSSLVRSPEALLEGAHPLPPLLLLLLGPSLHLLHPPSRARLHLSFQQFQQHMRKLRMRMQPSRAAKEGTTKERRRPSL